MKTILKKIAFILVFGTIWSIVGIITPTKYDVSVMALTGWWTCIIWTYMFRTKKEKALEALYDCIKEIKKDGGILIRASKKQSDDLFDKLNNL